MIVRLKRRESGGWMIIDGYYKGDGTCTFNWAEVAAKFINYYILGRHEGNANAKQD